MKSLIICCKLFLEERMVLSARRKVLDDAIDAVNRKINQLKEEIANLDEE